MIKYLKYTIVTLLLSGLFYSARGQYDPLYTQYMFNPLALNPAYAGTNGVLNAMIMSRHQWVGFEDAPSTQTFSIHTPVASKNIGTGLSIVHDKIGPVTNTNAFFDYSFQFYLNEEIKLSLGLKAGFSHFQRDLSRYLSEIGTDDPAYSDVVETKLLPNFGFGAYFYSERFYAGLSMPRLLENKIGEDGTLTTMQAPKESRLYLLMAGYVHPLNDDFILKPSFILRATSSAPLSYDVNLSVLIRQKFWVGAMVRPGYGFGALLQYQILPQIRAGYAFDMSTNKMMTHQNGTHEVMISYEFNFRKENIQNPRYF